MAAMPLAAWTMLSKPRRPRHGPELDDDEAGVSAGELLRREAEAGERAGPVAEEEDVGAVQERVEALGACGGAEVENGAPLAEQRVGRGAGLEIGKVGRVEAKDVGAKRTEEPTADRSGDHPRQVEDADPARGCDGIAADLVARWVFRPTRG
jgi:hypothetical protein